jgi:hypothetical protein
MRGEWQNKSDGARESGEKPAAELLHNEEERERIGGV